LNDLGTAETVGDVRATPGRRDDPAIAEDTEVLADIALGQAEVGAQLADGPGSVGESVDEQQPLGIREGLAQPCVEGDDLVVAFRALRGLSDPGDQAPGSASSGQTTVPGDARLAS
jgi:hypothetical protein